MNPKSVVIPTEQSGIFLRPTPGTPPLGVRLYQPDPPNLPERSNKTRRLFWQPEED